MIENTPEIVCTLFEASYGIGAAALINSLVASGYRGKVYVGFRGVLPAWAADVQRRSGYVWASRKGAVIEFVRLETNSHLTNFKPEFMLHIMEVLEPEASGIIYFDPDITIRCKWEFFRKWLKFGMMFCEDVNSPLHPTHPKRMMWRCLFPDLLKASLASSGAYVNGGFLGIRRQDLNFLRSWSAVIEKASPFTGGPAGWYSNQALEPFSPFSAFDQDALNVALMASSDPVSIVGPEGMDFKPGGYIMSHALGPAKPWVGSFLRRALVGRAPSHADRSFVKHVSAGPLKPLSDLQLAIMRVDLLMAKILAKLIH
jgi:hypothetical protein